MQPPLPLPLLLQLRATMLQVATCKPRTKCSCSSLCFLRSLCSHFHFLFPLLLPPFPFLTSCPLPTPLWHRLWLVPLVGCYGYLSPAFALLIISMLLFMPCCNCSSSCCCCCCCMCLVIDCSKWCAALPPLLPPASQFCPVLVLVAIRNCN